MASSPVALVQSERIAPMQVIVTSTSRIRRERRLRRSRKRIRTGAVAGCVVFLAGEDDPGKDGEEVEYRFKDFHVELQLICR